MIDAANLSDLALDLSKRRLCWLDSLGNKLECSDYEGRSRTVVLSYNKNLSHLTAFAVNNGKLYWSDRFIFKMLRACKSNNIN